MHRSTTSETVNAAVKSVRFVSLLALLAFVINEISSFSLEVFKIEYNYELVKQAEKERSGAKQRLVLPPPKLYVGDIVEL